jgi:hypothetical protein
MEQMAGINESRIKKPRFQVTQEDLDRNERSHSQPNRHRKRGMYIKTEKAKNVSPKSILKNRQTPGLEQLDQGCQAVVAFAESLALEV